MMGRGLGPHASRRGLLQSGGVHVDMPELGVTKLPVVPVMDQPLVEVERFRHPLSRRISSRTSPRARARALTASISEN
jgi:hypothetical protein